MNLLRNLRTVRISAGSTYPGYDSEVAMNKKERLDIKAEATRLRHAAKTHRDETVRLACRVRADYLERQLKEDQEIMGDDE